MYGRAGVELLRDACSPSHDPRARKMTQPASYILPPPHLPSSEIVSGWSIDGILIVKPSSILTCAERQNDLIANFFSLTVGLLRAFSRRSKHVACTSPMTQRIRLMHGISNFTMSKAAGRAGRLAEAMTLVRRVLAETRQAGVAADGVRASTVASDSGNVRSLGHGSAFTTSPARRTLGQGRLCKRDLGRLGWDRDARRDARVP